MNAFGDSQGLLWPMELLSTQQTEAMPWEFPSPSPHLFIDLSHQAKDWECSECAFFPLILEKCFLVLKLGRCCPWGTMWMESPGRSYFTLVVCITFSFLENTEIHSIPPPPARLSTGGQISSWWERLSLEVLTLSSEVLTYPPLILLCF